MMLVAPTMTRHETTPGTTYFKYCDLNVDDSMLLKQVYLHTLDLAGCSWNTIRTFPKPIPTDGRCPLLAFGSTCVCTVHCYTDFRLRRSHLVN